MTRQEFVADFLCNNPQILFTLGATTEERIRSRHSKNWRLLSHKETKRITGSIEPLMHAYSVFEDGDPIEDTEWPESAIMDVQGCDFLCVRLAKSKITFLVFKIAASTYELATIPRVPYTGEEHYFWYGNRYK